MLVSGAHHHFSGDSRSRRGSCTRFLVLTSVSFSIVFLLAAALATRTVRFWMCSVTLPSAKTARVRMKKKKKKNVHSATMMVHHAGCSQERIDPESASVGYSVRYTGIAVCSVLGVATVVLSLFLFTKLVLKTAMTRVSRPTRRSYNDSAYKPNLEVGAGQGNAGGNDDVQIPYVPPQEASTEPPRTTTPSALALGGGTEWSSPRMRFYGRKSHLEDTLPRSARTGSSDDGGDGRLEEEDSASYRAFGEI
ncbi:hypothetical protein HPB50_013633 [Hyalomma asiaticum]|uniref:Uncharacterized protein n=1 Tax=Hyalomma asiaticum TaxID=266040 RepID=A0ACB7SW58_HYAAI|nr:hypothetical protein HPB50_013633 [Hyalomma asiaticum]